MKSLLIAISLFLLIIFNGCGSTTVNNNQVPTNTGDKINTTNSQNKDAKDRNTTKALKQYVYENYGGNGNPEYKISWYNLIKDIKVVGDNATVETDIYPDQEGKNVANNIANAVLFCNEELNINSVMVLDLNGHYLFDKDKP